MASGVSLGARGQGYELNIKENGENAVISEKRVSYTGDRRTYCAYAKRIDFLFFSEFF